MKSLASRYEDLLKKMNLSATVEKGESADSVVFDVCGTRHVLIVEKDDPRFFWVMTVHGLGSLVVAPDAALERARDVNAMVKGAKVVPVPEDRVVRCSVESFISRAPASREVLERTIEVLRVASHEFFKGMAPAVFSKPTGKRRSARAKARKGK